MPAPSASVSAYTQVNVETASQGKLVVMMFNGAIQRAEEARRRLEQGKVDAVHNNLIRAQDIVAELRASLDMSAGEIARNLDRVYEYFQHLLVRANIRKDPQPIAEVVELMTQMRDTWKELFQIEEAAPQGVPTPPKLNQHGSSVMNLQG